MYHVVSRYLIPEREAFGPDQKCLFCPILERYRELNVKNMHSLGFANHIIVYE